ncbi:MAG TPA: monofunctional biosynthetic peptidoglycan transglycosylase [Steroidobacteraceae bacterium]|nr:monofunctional biosynthetic peptidoglycan transglycosylase [Steroidobacteraceae bacterium]
MLLFACLLAALGAVLTLRYLSPPTSAFMLEASAQAKLQGERHYRTDYRWRSLAAISPEVAIAVVASEDQHFPDNDGFDFDSIRAALRAHERGARLRGASTITQQVAKNLFLWSGRSFLRKGLEAGLTVLIDHLWSKQRTLEVYLNIAQFGPGIFGVEAAAHRYFRTSAAHLTRDQAALLAAVLPDPLRLHPNAPSRYVMAQHDWILQQIANLGGPGYLGTVAPRFAPLGARIAAHHGQ